VHPNSHDSRAQLFAGRLSRCSTRRKDGPREKSDRPPIHPAPYGSARRMDSGLETRGSKEDRSWRVNVDCLNLAGEAAMQAFAKR
jgi:hypothetical protein